MQTNQMTIGILAHVDAGKTTLSEGILYLTGSTRRIGRVDHKDAYLDTYSLEKERGITIFSKQALFTHQGRNYTLLDTPGHADFSPEMERTLQVLDAAILVISGPDGVTGQAMTLWGLLEHYRVPTFLFVNKMDQPGSDRAAIQSLLQSRFGSSCIDFTQDLSSDALQEALALCDEQLTEEYLSGRKVSPEAICGLFAARKVFPCFYGSALRLEGVETLLEALARYGAPARYGDVFGARIFKIARDTSGARMTYLKVTGGTLRVRDEISYESRSGETLTEKIDQIRVYSGAKYETLPEAPAGSVIAVTGLSGTYAGQGIGDEKGAEPEVLQPILSCKILLPEGMDAVRAYPLLSQLSEEEPMLQLRLGEDTGDLSVEIMGEVQMEILRHLASERFGMEIGFGPASVVYRETIRNQVEGVGHFEPLRHYAEVHLLLTPGEPGSGLVFDTDCKTDQLAKNWQRLILTHLEEARHPGVLTGSEITDMRITLIGGRAHEKHTEGGDFRQATYRAVRQGLMMAENILLEPVYQYRIELPAESIGRALSDLTRMDATTDPPEQSGDTAILTGQIPAASLGNYASELAAYTHGTGQLSVTLKGYEPCHNAEEVIERTAYDPEADLARPASSVFCSHGVGTVVPWDEVRSRMHVDTGWTMERGFEARTDRSEMDEEDLASFTAEAIRKEKERKTAGTGWEQEARRQATNAELKTIFERTYGAIPDRAEKAPQSAPRKVSAPKYRAPKPVSYENEYLLVDGYNVIYSNPDLKKLADHDIKAARDRLMEILSNFQGYRRETVILVFDAYLVSGGQERIYRYHNLDVVFTREAETADQYIERTAHDLSRKSKVTVATSDGIEQIIIFSGGALRMSAAEFWNQIAIVEQDIRDAIERNNADRRH